MTPMDSIALWLGRVAMVAGGLGVVAVVVLWAVGRIRFSADFYNLLLRAYRLRDRARERTPPRTPEQNGGERDHGA